MKIGVFDIETNGFYDKVTTGHCAWVNILANKGEDDEYIGFRPDDMHNLNRFLNSLDLLVAHNGIGYDVPVLEKLYGAKIPVPVYDTQVVSRLKTPDLTGGHSLRNLGKRIGILKGHVSEKEEVEEEEEEVWEVFTEDMYDYCKQDVVVTTALLRRFLPDYPTLFALRKPIDFTKYPLTR